MTRLIEKRKKAGGLSRLPAVLAISLPLSWLAVGCEPLGSGDPTPLGFRSNLSAPSSRATSPDGTWAGNDTVAVYVSGATKSDGITAADDTPGWFDFAVSNNELYPVNGGLYWPRSGDVDGDVTAYAYYPTTAVGTWNHADQSTADNLAAADVLYAPENTFNLSAAKNNGTDELTFRHQVAMVRVRLKPGKDMDLETLGKVKGEFYGYTSIIGWGLPSSKASHQGDWDVSGTEGWVKGLATISGTADVDTFLTVLLPPRTVPQDREFIKFVREEADGTKVEAVYKPRSGDLVLEAGYRYDFEATVGKEEVTLIRVNGFEGNSRPDLPPYDDDSLYNSDPSDWNAMNPGLVPWQKPDPVNTDNDLEFDGVTTDTPDGSSTGGKAMNPAIFPWAPVSLDTGNNFEFDGVTTDTPDGATDTGGKASNPALTPWVTGDQPDMGGTDNTDRRGTPVNP